MAIKRKAGMLLALPVVVTALAGAAQDPTLTYHGYFDDYSVSGEACQSMAGLEFDGVWTVRVPDRKGDVAWLNFQSRMDFPWGGRPTMFMFEHESVVLTRATETGFSAYTTSALWGMPGDKELNFTLSADGRFTYTYVSFTGIGNQRVAQCTVDFNGHQLS